ncbi:hypothetical protein HID58_032025 [Brassica napus]|uniref:Uncharacterized protein n=1 Tax=Brassica napus TaxID=3708 RepID=A0ABQ8BV85_BRANA|nr:hypothetical protein HID58_032025 [Brassica napus]
MSKVWQTTSPLNLKEKHLIFADPNRVNNMELELVGWVTSFRYLRHSVNDSYDEILGEHVCKINFKLMDERYELECEASKKIARDLDMKSRRL